MKKETWWWTEQIREVTTANLTKKLSRDGNMSNDDEDKEVNKVTKKQCKNAVAIAKEEAYAAVYKKLDTAEGNKIIYKLAKTRYRRTKYICDNIFINDKEGQIQTDTTKIIEVWKEHHVELLNVTNP